MASLCWKQLQTCLKCFVPQMPIWISLVIYLGIADIVLLGIVKGFVEKAAYYLFFVCRVLGLVTTIENFWLETDIDIHWYWHRGTSIGEPSTMHWRFPHRIITVRRGHVSTFSFLSLGNDAHSFRQWNRPVQLVWMAVCRSGVKNAVSYRT